MLDCHSCSCRSILNVIENIHKRISTKKKLQNIPGWSDFYKNIFICSYKIWIEIHQYVIMVIISEWWGFRQLCFSLLFLIFLQWTWIGYIINVLTKIKSMVFPKNIIGIFKEMTGRNESGSTVLPSSSMAFF